MKLNECKIYLGSNEINKIYLGSELVYGTASEPKKYTIQLLTNGELVYEYPSCALPYTQNYNGIDICTIREHDGTYLVVDWNVDGVSYPTYISVGQVSAHENLGGNDYIITWKETNIITVNQVPTQSSG